MTRNATDSELSAEQVRALESLLTGSSMTEAAEAAGVARSTLYRWLRDDYEFQAQLNAGKRAITEAVTPRLLGLADVAVDTLSAAVRGGDAKAALEMLKGLGLLTGERVRVGSDDARALREEAKLAKRSQDNLRSLQMQLIGH